MNARHRIRLAGPWRADVLQSSSHHELAGTQLKAVLDGTGDSLDQPFYGKLTLRRNFNLPTGLDEHSIVRLCVEGLASPAHCKIILNRQPLDRTGGGSPVGKHTEIVVTQALENFNKIEIVLTSNEVFSPVQILNPPDSVIVPASVWLEIE